MFTVLGMGNVLKHYSVPLRLILIKFYFALCVDPKTDARIIFLSFTEIQNLRYLFYYIIIFFTFQSLHIP